MDESVKMLSTKCRLCGELENFNSDIFSEEAKLRELPRKMETCLPIKVSIIQFFFSNQEN